MSEDKTLAERIARGGDIEFIDIAALSIATAIFISAGNNEVLDTIGSIAESLREAFEGDKEDSKD